MPQREGLLQAALGVVCEKELGNRPSVVEERRLHRMDAKDEAITMICGGAAPRCCLSGARWPSARWVSHCRSGDQLPSEGIERNRLGGRWWLAPLVAISVLTSLGQSA